MLKTLEKSGDSTLKSPAGVKDLIKTEVKPASGRRRFTAEYKLKILNALDRCETAGERGALIRREGVFSSCVTEWRKARNSGALSALNRIPGPKPRDQRNAEVADLEKEISSLRARLEQAEVIIDVQKKVSAMFGIMNPKNPSNGNK